MGLMRVVGFTEFGALVRRLGADVVVPRGPDVAARMRQVVPDGVDAVLGERLRRAGGWFIREGPGG